MEDLLRRRLLSIQMSDSCRDFFVLGQLLTSHIVDDSKSALEPHGVYLFDTGLLLIMWIGKQVPSPLSSTLNPNPKP